MWKSIRKLFKRKKTIRSEEIPQEHNEVTSEDRIRPQGIAQEHNRLTDEDRIAPHDTNSRFRVLILGPANAGKTTLLERLTESPAGAAIVTRNGRRVILFFPLYRYSGLIYSFISQIKEVPRGYDQVKNYHSKCMLWFLDVFILSSGASTMSMTKSLTHQTLALFSTTLAVSKREGSRKSRLSGTLFERAHQLGLHSNCTQFGMFAHVMQTSSHSNPYRFVQALYSHRQ